MIDVRRAGWLPRVVQPPAAAGVGAISGMFHL
jgi:hypothetical protein